MEKIWEIIDKYFDDPCNVCEAQEMNGTCIVQRHKCPFDLQEDMKNDMVTEILDAIK